MKRLLISSLLIFLGTQAFANWRCEADRCQEYTNCSLNGVSMACSYKSGGVEYGGVDFENGEVFSIEWISEYFDNSSNLINEPKDGYFALVNNTKRRFNVIDNGCVQFLANSALPEFKYGMC
jgi:hypothetical protein